MMKEIISPNESVTRKHLETEPLNIFLSKTAELIAKSLIKFLKNRKK